MGLFVVGVILGLIIVGLVMALLIATSRLDNVEDKKGKKK